MNNKEMYILHYYNDINDLKHPCKNPFGYRYQYVADFLDLESDILHFGWYHIPKNQWKSFQEHFSYLDNIDNIGIFKIKRPENTFIGEIESFTDLMLAVTAGVEKGTMMTQARNMLLNDLYNRQNGVKVDTNQPLDFASAVNNITNFGKLMVPEEDIDMLIKNNPEPFQTIDNEMNELTEMIKELCETYVEYNSDGEFYYFTDIQQIIFNGPDAELVEVIPVSIRHNRKELFKYLTKYNIVK